MSIFVAISQSDLYIQVKPVVEVSTPEEMSETKADIKGREMFVTQGKQSEDVHKALIPPGCYNTEKYINKQQKQHQVN